MSANKSFVSTQDTGYNRRLGTVLGRHTYGSFSGYVKVKGKCILYSAFIVVPHTQGAQVRITQFYLQITPYLPLPRKRSPDGASPERGCGHLIAAYYSFIYPERMDG